jgi:sphingosine kinase
LVIFDDYRTAIYYAPLPLGLLLRYFAHIKKPGVDFHRERDQVVLAFSSLSEAKTWEMALKWLAATGTVGEGPVPRRKLLVLLNPVGGLRKGRKIWAQIEPMFALSHVDATMVETTHANHAKEHVQGCTLDDLGNGIATISGDGLLNEVIQGLMERPDSAKARRIPLAVIPAGSGNGLAVSLMTPGPVSAVWNIIKGATRELDLSSVRQGSTQRWAFLSVAWGLTADIDMESEKYRWMGETRFTVAAIPRIFRLKSYVIGFLLALRTTHWGFDGLIFPRGQAQGVPLCFYIWKLKT